MKTFAIQKINFQVLVVALSFYSLVVTPFVKATEIVVTGNGSDSSSEVAIQTQTQTTTTQTNTADVTSDVATTSTTGDNTASNNSGGDTSIETGDISNQTSIENQANVSYIDTSECCASDINAEISENGAESTNGIDVQQSTTNSVLVTQNAVITNSISGYANTGNNSANDNTGGDVSISTGSISVAAHIENGPVNSASVKSSGGTVGLNAGIFQNGAGTVNSLSAKIVSNPNVFINNFSDIDNFVTWEANTGGNGASGNSGGDVSIITGNIDLEIFIKNFVNLSQTEISCCDQADPGDPPSDEEDDPGEVGGPSSSGSSSGGGFSGSSIPAGSEAGAGGAGILGLSDTSGGQLQSLIFMMGMIMLALGVKFTGESLEKSASLAKRKHLA